VNTAVTVYNEDRALIKDTRTFTLDAGGNRVRFDDVTSGIVPGSVQVEPADGQGGVEVLEQNYAYDLVSTPQLLQRFLDQEVRVVSEGGRVFAGTLLSGSDDVILRRKDEGVDVIKLSQIREISFPDLPEGLASKPSLIWDLASDKSGSRDLTVTYATTGFTWSADYVVRLTDRADAVDLSGWVTVDNRSEATFKGAKLKLVAGKVAVVQDVATRTCATEVLGAYGYGMGGGAMNKSRPVERGFFDYHLYEMPRPVTLDAKEKKQVQFVQVEGAKAEVTYKMTFDGYFYTTTTATRHPTILVKLVNDEASHLGVPLPAGTVRVYKADTDGAVELAGESRIEHTPKDEKVELQVGEAFDLVGEWKQKDHKVVGAFSDEYTYEMVVRNHKSQDARVQVDHQAYTWGEWKVTRSTAPWTKADTGSLRFDVDVPAGGETKVEYVVRTRW